VNHFGWSLNSSEMADSALAHVLGPWLNGEAQAALNHLQRELDSTRVDIGIIMTELNATYETLNQITDERDGLIMEVAALRQAIRLTRRSLRLQGRGTEDDPIDLTQ